MTAISLQGVGKVFSPSVTALDGIDLEIGEGEFVTLIGPSGCGKTTLLRLMAGLEDPTSGRVTVYGDNPHEACRKHEIGVAFQRPALVPSRTSLKNVRLTLEITGGDDALSPEKLLDDFGLAEFMDHYPHQLSGGMQQRVNIAGALVHNPKILLLDEPFGALDELTRESMGTWLSGILADSAQTVVLVTHSVDEAVTLSNRVVVLSPRPGRVHTILEIDRQAAQKTHIDDSYLHEVARVRDALYHVMREADA